MRRLRAVPAVAFVIVLSALVGGFFGRNALATDDRVLEYHKIFSAAISAIESSYVDKLDADRLVYGAIRGMLGTLDPHSSFYDPKEYDVVVAAGEQVTSGLLAIALQAIGVPARSWLGWQLPIHTDDAFAKARIGTIDTAALDESLARGDAADAFDPGHRRAAELHHDACHDSPQRAWASRLGENGRPERVGPWTTQP